VIKKFKWFKNETFKKEDFESLRRKIVRLTVTSLSLSFVSLAIVGMQILYPFHIVLGLGIYVLSFIPFLRRVYLSRKMWRKHYLYTGTKEFFLREKRIIALSGLTLIFILALIIVRPLDGDVFEGVSDEEIKTMVNDDLYQSITAMDYLESSAQDLVTSLQGQQEDANTTEVIETKFSDFLQAVVYSESLTDRNRYFANIPYRLWQERVSSFTISYSLYVKKYELLHRIMSEVSGSEYKKKILNQYVPLYERNNVYNEMVGLFYAPKTMLRISAGWLYLKLFGDNDNEYGSEYAVLIIKSQEGYQYLSNNLDKTVLYSGAVAVEKTRNNMFEVWFPVQRTVANTMGHIVISNRGHEGLISLELLPVMRKEMYPGDIMLQRRNWYLSNVGIPGFWTHAALYTGTLTEMNNYFASEFPYDGFTNFDEYLETKFPEVYKDYLFPDKEGYIKSVIEAIEPGVVVSSLEGSAHADFVVVLRPKLTKQDKLLALEKAFSNYHKPYDYNFDFDTRDALVCSELVYDAYYERLPKKHGLHLETSLLNGRKMVSPLDMAKLYKAEHGTEAEQFEFVYFLRGYETEGIARVATESEFIESVDWNKFSYLQK
jgi:hypothetical protein